MNLLVCLITHNRLTYTQKTLQSFWKTITCPYHLVIVDNNSTDGTKDYLRRLGQQYKGSVILNPDNFYPGRACNQGWMLGVSEYPDATYLMRLDNDMLFSPAWADRAEGYFEAMPPLGQLGLDFTALDDFNGDDRYLTTIGGKTVNAWPGNIGGPCIIRREVYDEGARYDETPWHDENLLMLTPQEDVKFSLSMHTYGYIFGHATDELARTFATPDKYSEYPEYYRETMRKRGYKWPV